MYKEKFEKLIFILIIVSGLAYAYYHYVFTEQLENINTLTKTSEQKLLQKEELEDIKNNLPATKKALEKMEANLRKVNKMVPETDDTRQFCIDLYYYLKAHNIKTLGDISPGDRQVNDKLGHEKQIVKLSISGSQSDITSFIKYLKTLPRKVIISKCSFKITGETEWTADLQLDIFFISKEKVKK